MEEAPENGKESRHSAHANGMNEWTCDARKLKYRLNNESSVNQTEIGTGSD